MRLQSVVSFRLSNQFNKDCLAVLLSSPKSNHINDAVDLASVVTHSVNVISSKMYFKRLSLYIVCVYSLLYKTFLVFAITLKVLFSLLNVRLCELYFMS